MADTHEHIDSFYEAIYDDVVLVRDAAHRIWTAWEGEYGDWWAIRARDEDDDAGPDGDRWRPVGPTHVEHLPFPLRCVVADEALEPGGLQP